MKWLGIVWVFTLSMIAGSLAAQNIEWIRQFGTEADETVLEVSVYGTDVYVCGKVEGALPGQTHFGSSDAFVRKYDINGNEIWTRQFGTSGTAGPPGTAGLEKARGISVDASGIYVCGTVGGALPGQTRPDIVHDAFIRKYDSDGNEMWTRQFGDGDSEANAVSVDVTGVYLVGYTDMADVQYLRKYDVNGTEVWTHQFEFTHIGNTRSSYEVAAVDVHASGVYVGGEVPGFFPGQTHQGGFDAYISKYDFNGAEIWTRQFGSEGRDRIKGIFTNETGVYATGTISGFGPFLSKYDTNGNEVWTRQLAVDEYRPLFGGISGDATGVYVSGEIESDMIVFKYDFQGNEVWSQQFGTSSSDSPGGISVDASGVYVGGGTDGTFPSQSNLGGSDAVLAKIAEDDQPPQVSCSVSPVRPNKKNQLQINFSASDDQELSSVTAVIDIGCQQVPVQDGDILNPLKCNKKNCKVRIAGNGEFIIKTQNARLIVTATDISGNVTTCSQDLCTTEENIETGNDESEVVVEKQNEERGNRSQYRTQSDNYTLFQNYPNPFYPSTTISFKIPQDGLVSLAIYDLQGELVQVLHSGWKSQGHHNVVWDGTNLEGSKVTSGMYVCKLLSKDFVATKKLLYTR